MELKDKLIMLRKQAHLSQLELAERTDVSRQTISKWEVGLALPTRENLKQLAKIYNVSIDWICSDSDEPYVRPETIVFPPSPPEKERTEQKTSNVTNKTLKWMMGLIAILLVLVSIFFFMMMSERAEQQKTKPLETLPTKTIDPEEVPVENFDFTW